MGRMSDLNIKARESPETLTAAERALVGPTDADRASGYHYERDMLRERLKLAVSQLENEANWHDASERCHVADLLRRQVAGHRAFLQQLSD